MNFYVSPFPKPRHKNPLLLYLSHLHHLHLPHQAQKPGSQITTVEASPSSLIKHSYFASSIAWIDSNKLPLSTLFKLFIRQNNINWFHFWPALVWIPLYLLITIRDSISVFVFVRGKIIAISVRRRQLVLALSTA